MPAKEGKEEEEEEEEEEEKEEEEEEEEKEVGGRLAEESRAMSRWSQHPHMSLHYIKWDIFIFKNNSNNVLTKAM